MLDSPALPAQERLNRARRPRHSAGRNVPACRLPPTTTRHEPFCPWPLSSPDRSRTSPRRSRQFRVTSLAAALPPGIDGRGSARNTPACPTRERAEWGDRHAGPFSYRHAPSFHLVLAWSATALSRLAVAWTSPGSSSKALLKCRMASPNLRWEASVAPRLL